MVSDWVCAGCQWGRARHTLSSPHELSDERTGCAVLDTAAGVEVLGLGQDAASRQLRQRLELCHPQDIFASLSTSAAIDNPPNPSSGSPINGVLPTASQKPSLTSSLRPPPCSTASTTDLAPSPPPTRMPGKLTLPSLYVRRAPDAPPCVASTAVGQPTSG